MMIQYLKILVKNWFELRSKPFVSVEFFKRVFVARMVGEEGNTGGVKLLHLEGRVGTQR